MEESRKLLVGKIQQVVTNLGEGEGGQGWGPQPEESVGYFFLKQLHYLLHYIAAFWAFLVDKFNQVQPGESVGDFVLKQLHYLLHLLAAFWAFLVDKFNQVQPGESVGDFFLKQLHYLLHLLAAFWVFLVDKFNQVLPPPEIIDETLHKWAHVGLTRVLPIGLALLVFYWCCRTGCCCRMSGGAGRMMRAPGRMGALILRATFEANPRAYFINLRA